MRASSAPAGRFAGRARTPPPPPHPHRHERVRPATLRGAGSPGVEHAPSRVVARAPPGGSIPIRARPSGMRGRPQGRTVASGERCPSGSAAGSFGPAVTRRYRRPGTAGSPLRASVIRHRPGGGPDETPRTIVRAVVRASPGRPGGVERRVTARRAAAWPGRGTTHGAPGAGSGTRVRAPARQPQADSAPARTPTSRADPAIPGDAVLLFHRRRQGRGSASTCRRGRTNLWGALPRRESRGVGVRGRVTGVAITSAQPNRAPRPRSCARPSSGVWPRTPARHLHASARG